MRWRWFVAVAGTAVLVPAGVAHADPAEPTDFSTVIVGIEPATPTIDVDVVGGDSFLELTAEPGTEVVVLGYWGEPYLRFNADGTVDENRPVADACREREPLRRVVVGRARPPRPTVSRSGHRSPPTAATPGTTTAPTG